MGRNLQRNSVAARGAQQILKRSQPLPPPSSSSPSPSPPPLKPNNKQHQHQHQQHQTPSPPIPNLFTSPSLSSAITTLNSLSSSSFLNPNAILLSFLSLSPPLLPPARDALSFFRHLLSQSPSFSPSRSTFHSLLTHSLLSNPDNPNTDVSPVLSLMSSHGPPPDTFDFDITVCAFCSASRPHDAAHLLLSFPVPPDHSTYNFLIRHLTKSHPFSCFYSIIESLRPKIQPNLITYTTLIDSVCRPQELEGDHLVAESSQ